MKTASIVSDFINDFNLQFSEVGICFDALINFNLQFQNFNVESGVHIEPLLVCSIGNIYLLNPIIEKYKLPTFFCEMKYQFMHQKHKGLIIKGDTSLFGLFTITILPLTANCNLNTFNLLKAGILN